VAAAFNIQVTLMGEYKCFKKGEKKVVINSVGFRKGFIYQLQC